jgi:hypothetical protein
MEREERKGEEKEEEIDVINKFATQAIYFKLSDDASTGAPVAKLPI